LEEEDSSVILEWIGKKEDEWDKLGEQEFAGISVAGKTYDPFDVEGSTPSLVLMASSMARVTFKASNPAFCLRTLSKRRQVEVFTSTSSAGSMRGTC